MANAVDKRRMILDAAITAGDDHTGPNVSYAHLNSPLSPIA